jgi:drug/metabolite transporter (DMT)-like permease
MSQIRSPRSLRSVRTAVASAAIIDGARLRPIEWIGGVLIVGAAVVEARRPIEA